MHSAHQGKLDFILCDFREIDLIFIFQPCVLDTEKQFLYDEAIRVRKLLGKIRG